jgi:hypothetical protein
MYWHVKKKLKSKEVIKILQAAQYLKDIASYSDNNVDYHSLERLGLHKFLMPDSGVFDLGYDIEKMVHKKIAKDYNKDRKRQKKLERRRQEQLKQHEENTKNTKPISTMEDSGFINMEEEA